MDKRNIFVTNGGMCQNISEFLGPENKDVLLIPYAIPKKFYGANLKEEREKMGPWGHNISSIGDSRDPRGRIEEADALIIPGGNTYVLLNEMYDNNVVETIRRIGFEGKPIVGKSAGAGVLGPTIRTTNDWAVVSPQSLDAIGILPYQINPHFPFSEWAVEERAGRIHEFLEYNPDSEVIGLMEGSSLIVRGDRSLVSGRKGVLKFTDSQPLKYIRPGFFLENTQ